MDGRVALLEAVNVVIAIHMGRGGVVSPDRAFGIESRTVGRPPVPTTSVDFTWLQLDQVSLEIFALNSHAEELPAFAPRQGAREFQFRTP